MLLIKTMHVEDHYTQQIQIEYIIAALTKCSVRLYLQSSVGVLMSCRVFVYFCVYIDVQYFGVAFLFSFLYNVLYQVVPVA
jgi:hypothetical protein